MSGKYKRKSSFRKLPVIIGLAVIIVVMMIGLVACQISGNADSTEPTTESTADTTGAATTETTEHVEETTTATTEATTEPTTEETEPTEHEHEYTEKVTSATCAAEGYTTYTCACGDSYKGSYISAPGHNYGEWVTTKEPTKTTTGTAQRKCGKCNATETKTLPKVVAGHTHSYTSKITTEATCSREGVRTYTCTCGDTYTESISKGAHSWGGWTTTKEPTTTANGTAQRTCSTCGRSESKTLDKKPAAHTHSYGEWVTTQAPTLTTTGTAKRTCSCGHSENKTLPVVAASTHSHEWGNWVTTVQPTTTRDGTAERSCMTFGCGVTETKTLPKVEAPAVHTHSWGSWVTTRQPTTTAEGTAERSCMTFGCGVTETKALPKVEAPVTHTHSWGDWTVIAPTCQTDGYKYHSCSCGAEETAPGSPATGHSYSVTSETPATCSANGSRTYACSCGDSYSESVTGSHSWVHTPEQGHYENARYVCHCGGWSGTDLGSYSAHVSGVSEEDRNNHSYYSTADWVVDVPAKDTCSSCGATK